MHSALNSTELSANLSFVFFKAFFLVFGFSIPVQCICLAFRKLLLFYLFFILNKKVPQVLENIIVKSSVCYILLMKREYG